MNKKLIEKHLREKYEKIIMQNGKIEYFALLDVVQIVDDFMADRVLEKKEHWKELVAVYYRFYESKFNAKPDFTRLAPKTLQEIIDKLRRTAEQNNIEWTEQNASAMLSDFLVAAYSDKWLRENFILSNINKQFQKIRDMSPKEIAFIEDLKLLYFTFYKSKHELSPDFNDAELIALRSVVSKLKATADEKNVAWTKVNAERYLEKILQLAYGDKWIKQHFLLIHIDKQFQTLRDNERARQGGKKVGRNSEERGKEYLAGG